MSRYVESDDDRRVHKQIRNKQQRQVERELDLRTRNVHNINVNDFLDEFEDEDVIEQ